MILSAHIPFSTISLRIEVLIDRRAEELWNEIKQVVETECKKRLSKTKIYNKENWMSEQMAATTEQRSQWGVKDRFHEGI